MGDRERVLRIGSALAVMAVAGFLLGSCGGGDGSALTTRTEGTVTRTVTTRPDVTVTRPTLSGPSETETIQTAPATTAEQPTETTTEVSTTTAPAPTVTVTETEAETTEAVPTVPETTTPPTTAVAAEPTSSSDDTPWGWLVLVLALLVGLIVGVLAWRSRRAATASWSNRLTELSRRSLVALDDVLAEGSVVTGRIQALAADARALERHAPDERARAMSAQVRAGLDDLADTLAADRALRLASPPPTPEQLSFSTALIRQQVEQLQGVLRPPPDAPGP